MDQCRQPGGNGELGFITYSVNRKADFLGLPFL